jgi:hypothetical protein
MKAVNADADMPMPMPMPIPIPIPIPIPVWCGVVWCGVGDVTSNKAMAGGIYWSVCREGIVALIDLCTAACQAI